MNNGENIDAPFLPGLEPEEEKVIRKISDNQSKEEIIRTQTISKEPTCAMCELYGGTCPRCRKK